MTPITIGNATLYQGDSYQILRIDWLEPHRFRMVDQSELFNILGLWWKPL